MKKVFMAALVLFTVILSAWIGRNVVGRPQSDTGFTAKQGTTQTPTATKGSSVPLTPTTTQTPTATQGSSVLLTPTTTQATKEITITPEPTIAEASTATTTPVVTQTPTPNFTAGMMTTQVPKTQFETIAEAIEKTIVREEDESSSRVVKASVFQKMLKEEEAYRVSWKDSDVEYCLPQTQGKLVTVMLEESIEDMPLIEVDGTAPKDTFDVSGYINTKRYVKGKIEHVEEICNFDNQPVVVVCWSNLEQDWRYCLAIADGGGNRGSSSGSVKQPDKPTSGDNPTSTPGHNPTPTPGSNPTPTPGHNPTPTPGHNPTPTPGHNPMPTPVPSTDKPAHNPPIIEGEVVSEEEEEAVNQDFGTW